MKLKGSFFVIIMLLAVVANAQVPRVISYQGVLTASPGGSPINGMRNLGFALYESEDDFATPIWTETHLGVHVQHGVFAVYLGSATPFPSSVDFSKQYWLGISIDGGAELTPRFHLTASPYAMNIPSMGAEDGQVLKWNATSEKWEPASIKIEEECSTCVARSDSDSACVEWKYDGNGVIWTALYDQNSTPQCSLTYLGIAKGNAGNTVHGANRRTHVNLGANSVTGVSGYDYEFCTISGGSENEATNTLATVVGGASNSASQQGSFIGGGVRNQALGMYALVSGGFGNHAEGQYSLVCGGYGNSAYGTYSVIGGGTYNEATSEWSSVGGGQHNTADSTYTTVSGGAFNYAHQQGATVGGGVQNSADGYYNTVCGGLLNSASTSYATVCGGYFNNANGYFSAICGGRENTGNADYSFIGGGYAGTIEADSSVITGGVNNYIGSICSFIGGGSKNRITGNAWYSVICGGDSNYIDGYRSFIGGGQYNKAGTNFATIAGGDSNTVSTGSFIGGGRRNEASGAWAAIGGGHENIDTAFYGAIGGGYQNLLKGDYGGIFSGKGNIVGASRSDTLNVIAGGGQNEIYGTFSAILGGYDNTVSANFSQAFGRSVSVNDDYITAFYDDSYPGKVGINEPEPDVELHVNGSVKITDVLNLVPLAGSPPPSPAKGDIYYDEDDDKVKVCTDPGVPTWEPLN
jgi:hypothetical protein